jgi:hypothetical protein
LLFITSTYNKINVLLDQNSIYNECWHQLKPGDDALDGDRKKCQDAVKIIKEKKQEWEELEKTKETLL